MSRITLCGLLLCSLFAGGARAAEALPESVRDPFYGQVLFDFHQQNYFSAVTHLRAAQQQGRLPHHGDEAELLLGGLYLAYGMQKNAEAAFSQLLERQATPLDPALRNRVWLALAGIYFERGYEVRAAELLARIEGELAPQQEGERLLLESTLLTRQGRHAEAADRLAGARRDSLERGYAQYNLGVEQIRQKREHEGRALLEPLTKLDSSADPERAVLRDKANIAMGYSWLRQEEFARAKPWFERVGLHSPFASQALLGLGWVESGLGNRKGALAVWLPLTEGHAADPSVLEGLLAVPYTLNQLGARQQALDHYKKAISLYDGELKALQGIISGMNFVALAQDLADPLTTPEAGWQWRADIIPSSMPGPYLYRVMAGHEFQEALRNYRDLLFLERNLARWQGDLDAYEAMVDLRQAAHEARLPRLGATLAKLDGNTLQQRRDHYAGRLDEIAAANDAMALAEADEQRQLARLARIEARLKRLEGGMDSSVQQRKFALLKGSLIWRLETEYPARLWQTRRQLQELDASLAASSERRRSLTQAQARGASDFRRYRQAIAAARSQMVAMRQQATGLMGQYEQRLQQLTVAALQGLEARIRDYQGQALFAAAQIYDRAQYLYEKGERQ